MKSPLFVPVLPTFAQTPSSRPPGTGDPCTLVVLGGAGDLAKRKLYPALFDLAREGLLAPSFRLLGSDRVVMDDGEFKKLVRASIEGSDEIKGGIDEAVWARFSEALGYVAGDLLQPAHYENLRARVTAGEHGVLPEQANKIFYLAVPPSIFEPIVRQLSVSGLAPRQEDAAARPWSRVIVEKPFGRSLATALQLNHLVLSLFAEHQVYRIDHYLAKETVQNILVFRTANLIFEPLWNHQYISHVQITAAETVGVEQRGRYYEEAGVVRDMFQNHLMQLLTLTAMEPPVAMTADAVRDEKVKVLKSIVPFTAEDAAAAVRAQYAPGEIKGEKAPGYRSEPNVAKESVTPTYAALRVTIDNWRWQGVPFYLRSGKRMAKRVSEIAITFRTPPGLGLPGDAGPALEPNTLVMRVQPNEGIELGFQVKVPGAALALTPEIEVTRMAMDFTYSTAFGAATHPAYETLLLDCMIGDATLFARSDEVEAAWQVTDPLLSMWDAHPPAELPTYPAGSWGPREAEAYIARDGFRWRTP